MTQEAPRRSPDQAPQRETRRLIEAQRSVIPACDVPSLALLDKLVEQTSDLPGIGGYKVGFELGLRYGMPQVVETVRRRTNKPVIYDHQKAGTDIPETGKKFAEPLLEAGVNSAILFPFGGAATERQWIQDCQDAGLVVIVGGHMTQKEFLASEGGFIADDAPERMYRIAAENGVRDFVVPGNKVDYVEKYRQLLEEILGKGNFTLYAPGFVKQGGSIAETAQAAGDNWHAIVGTGIYAAPDMREAAKELTSKL